MDHRQRGQAQLALDLLGCLDRAVEHLDQHGAADAEQQPEQQAVGDVLAQRRLERPARHHRLVDDPDVRLPGVLEAHGDLGLGLLAQQLVEQVAAGLDLHLEVGVLDGGRILVDRLALEGVELPLQLLLLAQRRLIGGEGGALHLAHLLADDIKHGAARALSRRHSAGRFAGGKAASMMTVPAVRE